MSAASSPNDPDLSGAPSLDGSPSLDGALTATDVGRGVPEAPRLVVEIWLVLRDAQHLLMLKRSKARGGFWQGVSGRVEASDATLRDAALREISEETGLALAPRNVFDLGQGYAYLGFVSGTAFRKRCLGAWLPADLDPRLVQLSDEHTELRVVPMGAVGPMLHFDKMRGELNQLAHVLQTQRPHSD